MKSSLMPLLVKDIEIELFVFKKANQFESFKEGNQFESFKFRDHQLLDTLNFLGRSTFFDYFLKAHKTSEAKRHFACECFDSPEDSTQLSPYEAFFSTVCNKNPLQKDSSDFQNLLLGDIFVRHVVFFFLNLLDCLIASV